MTIDSARRRLHEIIFDADTPAGKAFDVALLILIVVSVIAVMLETVAVVRDLAGNRPAAVERELR
jgi:voltage-gated potassium channel